MIRIRLELMDMSNLFLPFLVVVLVIFTAFNVPNMYESRWYKTLLFDF